MDERVKKLEGLLREAREFVAASPIPRSLSLKERIDAALSGAPLRTSTHEHECACGQPLDKTCIHSMAMCWRPCRGECGGRVFDDGLCHQTHPLTPDKIKAGKLTDQEAPEARGPVGPPLDAQSVDSRAAAAAPEAGEQARLIVEELNKIPNPCCGKPGPSRMYGPGAEDGPVCHCGKPSAYESGLCADCGKALGSRPPDGAFVEAAPSPRPPEPEWRDWCARQMSDPVIRAEAYKDALDTACDALRCAMMTIECWSIFPPSHAFAGRELEWHRRAVYALGVRDALANSPSTPDPAPAAAPLWTGPECDCDFSPERGHQLGCAWVMPRYKAAWAAPAAASAGLCEICGLRKAPAILIDGVPKTACWRAWPGNAAHGRDYETLHAFECYRLGYERLRAASAGEGALREALREILRTSEDGESMRIAAEALGVPCDRTEG